MSIMMVALRVVILLLNTLIRTTVSLEEGGQSLCQKKP